MNSKFIWSQTNLNPVELERPDYRYWFSDLWINFKSSVGNKYFPHWMFVWENSVASGTFTQMKLEKKDTVWADIRWMNWDRVVIKQDWTYLMFVSFYVSSVVPAWATWEIWLYADWEMWDVATNGWEGTSLKLNFVKNYKKWDEVWFYIENALTSVLEWYLQITITKLS